MFVTNDQIMEHIGRKPDYEARLAELEAQREEIDRDLYMMRATLAYLEVGEIYEGVALRVEEFDDGRVEYAHLGSDSARGARVTKESGVWQVRMYSDRKVGQLHESVIVTDDLNARLAAKEWTAHGRVFKERSHDNRDAKSNRVQTEAA